MKKLILAALLMMSGTVYAEGNNGTKLDTIQPRAQGNAQTMPNKEEMMQRMQSMTPEQREQMMQKAREFMQSMTPEQRQKMQSMMQGKTGNAQ